MTDRRRRQIRPSMIMIGLILIMFGLYVWSPSESQFANAIARLDIKTEWATLLLLTGGIQIYCACVRSFKSLWLAHASGAMVGCWGFILMMSQGVMVPTAYTLGIIGGVSTWVMVRDAITSVKVRRLIHGHASE